MNGLRNPTATPGERVTRVGLIVLTGAVLLFLVAPILTIVPLSFSSGSFFYYPLPGLSLRWYQDFFTSSFWLSSLQNSLIIGISATVLATLLGTMAALGIWRARFPAQALVLAMLISPMVVPVVIIAVGVYFAFAPLGLTDGYLGLILAHATLGVPFVVITVLATLSAFDRTLLEPATRHHIIVRMLVNLKRLYVRMRSFPQARFVSTLLLSADPSATSELRDRGLLAYHLEDFSSAFRRAAIIHHQCSAGNVCTRSVTRRRCTGHTGGTLARGECLEH